jgi:hypothetical protein
LRQVSENGVPAKLIPSSGNAVVRYISSHLLTSLSILLLGHMKNIWVFLYLLFILYATGSVINFLMFVLNSEKILIPAHTILLVFICTPQNVYVCVSVYIN